MREKPFEPSGRVAALDGLRGWAALWVVLFHLGWESFGAVMPAFRSPIAAAFNGNLAVTVFFVLSGEALSSGYFSGRGLTQVAGLAIKRLPRLSIPVFFATLLTYLVARLGLAHDVTQAGAIVHRPDWYGRMHPDWLSVAAVARFAVVDVYASVEPRWDRMPFLWTMNTELLGSLLVFVLLLCWAHLRRPAAIVAALGILLFLSSATGDGKAAYLGNLSDFCFGVVLSYRRQTEGAFARRDQRTIEWTTLLAIAASLVASSLVALEKADGRYCPIIAPILVLAITRSPWADRMLSTPLSQWLGRASFPLYLVQYPVIISLTATCISVAANRGRLDQTTAALIVVASLVACLTAARLFELVEVLTRRVGQAVGRYAIRAPDDRGQAKGGKSASLPASA